MAKNSSSSENLSANILLIIGVIDLMRGFMHTFNINWAVTSFAHLDLSYARSDQLFLLGVFGMSNFLTGFLYILISQKAKNMAPYILGIIPLSYLVGWVGLRFSGVTPQADFLGKYFMFIYLGICFLSSLFYFSKKIKS